MGRLEYFRRRASRGRVCDIRKAEDLVHSRSGYCRCLLLIPLTSDPTALETRTLVPANMARGCHWIACDRHMVHPLCDTV